jgi:hypothetical protein
MIAGVSRWKIVHRGGEHPIAPRRPSGVWSYSQKHKTLLETKGSAKPQVEYFMLQDIEEIYGDKLAALDGDIGHVKEFYFDDKTWTIRYLVADMGSWLTGRHVLLSPDTFGRLDKQEKTLHVKLHKKQIENSSSLESHRSISRQYEMEYYCYPAEAPVNWPAVNRVLIPSLKSDAEAHLQHHRRAEKHLQSTRAVTGYSIQATDGTIGHVSGLLTDDQTWTIREVVVETGHWYPNKQILISINKIERISYEESKIFVNLTKADIQRTAESELARARAENHRAENIRD